MLYIIYASYDIDDINLDRTKNKQQDKIEDFCNERI